MQYNVTNFTYNYADRTNITDYNIDNPAVVLIKAAPAIARTNLTARVSAANAVAIGLPRLAAKSPTGRGANAAPFVDADLASGIIFDPTTLQSDQPLPTGYLNCIMLGNHYT